MSIATVVCGEHHIWSRFNKVDVDKNIKLLASPIEWINEWARDETGYRVNNFLFVVVSSRRTRQECGDLVCYYVVCIVIS